MTVVSYTYDVIVEFSAILMVYYKFYGYSFITERNTALVYVLHLYAINRI